MKKVQATAKGYYKDDLKQIGEVFEVEDNATGKWFVEVEMKAVEEAVVKPAKKTK